MSEASKIKCGVAGYGYLGQHHARIYHELPNVEFVGVFEQDAKRAEKCCKKYKCQHFQSVDELAKACDGVSIVVPTDKHHELAIPLLEQGCHLLVEKPLCASLEEAESILKTAKANNCIVQVGHIEHFNPVMSFLEQEVNDVRYITAERLAPFNPRGTEVGVVLDLMIHDIGIILQLVNSPVKQVDSVGVNVVSPTEDIANARISFENGCIANLSTSRVSLKKVRKIRLFQPRTYVSMDFMEQEGYLMNMQGEEANIKNIKRRKVPIEKGEPLKRELADFVECLKHGTEPKVNGLLGQSALELAIRITEQIQAQGYQAMDAAHG